MDTSTIEKLNESFKDLLRGEQLDPPLDRTVEDSRSRAEPSEGVSTGLPRRVAGGFAAVSEDLDRRARDWRNMVRILEQQRPQLEAAEASYASSLEALNAVFPEVEERSRALFETLRSTRGGDVTGNLADRFNEGLRALDELESIAGSLSANLLWVRSAWEQYAQSILKAQKMREELARG